MRMSADQRRGAILCLLRDTPNCYYTHHQISQYLGLKTTPYTRNLIRQLVDMVEQVHMIEVTAINGKQAWGYYYSENVQQLQMEMSQCL